MFTSDVPTLGPFHAPPGRVEVRAFTDGLVISKHRRSEEFYVGWSIGAGLVLLVAGAYLRQRSESAGNALAIAGGVILGAVLLYFLATFLVTAAMTVFAVGSLATKGGRRSWRRGLRSAGKEWKAVSATSLQDYLASDGDRVWTCPSTDLRQVSPIRSAGLGSEFSISTAYGEMPLRAGLGRQGRLRRLHERITGLLANRR